MQDSQSSLKSAVECLQCGDSAQAEELCREVLQREPENAKAWHLCGISHAQRDSLDEAVSCFEKAVQFDDTTANYHYNLGLAYRELERLDEAIDAYRAAIAIQSDSLEARSNLGNALAEKGLADEAIDCFRRLIEQFPDNSVAHYNLGNILQDQGDVVEAITLFRRAVELDPDFSAARENLGRTLSDCKRFDEALQAWQSWLEHDPDNAVARHMIAAISSQDIPDRCNDECVRQTFNADFAKTFERQLRRIDYRVPDLVGDALEAIESRSTDLAVLDAGCGTGLCGPVLRPTAKQMVGLDLSGDMLREAEKRGIYDRLVEDELTRFLDLTSDRYDLIVSGDTLCYFGELGEVLTGVFRCLRDNGTLIFTVEATTAEEDQERYSLQPNGRYRHAESYVRHALAEAGFCVARSVTEFLRVERGRPVAGFVVTGQR